MAVKHISKHSTSLAIREMQIKPTLRFYKKWLSLTKQIITAADENVGENQIFFIPRVSENLYSQYGNQGGESLKAENQSPTRSC